MATAINLLDKETKIFFEYFEKAMKDKADVYEVFPVKIEPIDENSIRYNFEEGLKNLEYFSGRFDSLEIVDASRKPGELKSLLKIKQQRLVYLNNDLPSAVEETVLNIAGRFNDISRREENDNDEEQGWDYNLGR